MNNIKYWLNLILLLTTISAFPQQNFLNGKILGEENGKASSSLPGAIIIWAGTQDVTLSDVEGKFQIPITVKLPHVLVVSYVGYRTDSVEISAADRVVIRLYQNLELKSAEVIAKRQDTEISTLKTLNTETITEGEILKAACCNLSESFETNPSVDVSYSDAITGTKEIQMLGLSGIYTQTLIENIPSVRGLAVPFGFAFIPGPWIESIQISKGAGSVANGYEAMTGQINLEFKKPESAPPIFINAFADNQSRLELNSILSTPINKKWSYMLMMNANSLSAKNDDNDDGFLDAPLVKHLNIYNRFRYHSGNRLEAQLGIKGLIDDRIGGQSSFDPNKDKGTMNAYGFRMKTKRAEFYSKTGVIYPATPYKSMGLQTSLIVHEQDAYFGLKTYNATQGSVYANYVYVSMIQNTDHKIKTGIDFKYDHYDEDYNDSSFNRTESVPGIYGEYTFGSEHHKFGLIAGSRVDYHNLFGWLYTPRLHLKYNFTPEFIVRVSGGRGYRTPNPYADNIGVMVSSRRLVIEEKPKLEDAWNGGINLTTRFHFLHREGSLSLDFYRTDFVNQLVVDQYSQNDAVLYYNLEGSSYANSFQVTLTHEIIERLTVKLAYKIDDTHTDYRSYTAMAKPMLARDKALFDVSYKDEKEHWRFSTTFQWEGVKPLASTVEFGNGTDVKNDYSPSYFQLIAQVTRVFKNWEIYLGGENLLNYTQENPIISPDNPFGPTFDATRVWGPIMGRKFYVGIRWSIPSFIK